MADQGDTPSRERAGIQSDDAAADGPQQRLTPAGNILQRLRVPEQWTEDEREEVLDDLFFDGREWLPYLKRFYSLIALSTAIATFGLIADSAAVVIGAMLVAPLMIPILALSVAVVYARIDRMIASALTIVLGTLVAILVGVFVTSIVPGTLTATDLPRQILDRTTPGLLDLGIAISAGLAAGYVLAHRKIGSSLPGVAISVALVPPLATIGITLRLGATQEWRGALLLFLTNLVAILLAAGAVMVVSGFVPRHIRSLAKGHLTIGFVVSAVALVAITIPLAIHTIEQVGDSRLARIVVEEIPTWDENASVVGLDVQIVSGRAQITIDVSTSGEGEPAWELAELIAKETDIDIDLTVTYQSRLVDAASTG